MKTKMAVVRATAKENTHPVESYRKGDNPSRPNVKELLGFLLFRLIAGQAKQSDWQLFDGLLRRFYMRSGVGFHGLQSTNSTQRVSE